MLWMIEHLVSLSIRQMCLSVATIEYYVSWSILHYDWLFGLVIGRKICQIC